MYRNVNDFVKDWTRASEGTIKVLESLTDDKLGQSIVEGHSTLGWLGWHIATAPIYFASLVGVNLGISTDPSDIPSKASTILDTYKEVTKKFKQEVENNFTDEQLLEEVDQHGTLAPRGEILRTLIDHQTHHRGQMTVLLRQAGLPVPGIMGPTQEQN
ncbi:DinB family protein [Aquibacillus kalidii]|uniref:DinB family protein n=1 Tax=Aquibacillus kalidii TaxID=2762597 RepID=UPI0016455654|nr:DinB family protein [Aquibacillus kalidii]